LIWLRKKWKFDTEDSGMLSRAIRVNRNHLRGETIVIDDLSRAVRDQLAQLLRESLSSPVREGLVGQSASVMVAYLAHSAGDRFDDAMDAGLLQLTGIWDFRTGVFRQRVIVYEERSFVALSLSLDTSQLRKSRVAEWQAVTQSLSTLPR
jgi:hypothetical protein